MAKGLLATFQANKTEDELPPPAQKVKLNGKDIWQFLTKSQLTPQPKRIPPRVPADLAGDEPYLDHKGRLRHVPSPSPTGKAAPAFNLSRAVEGETVEDAARRRLALKHELAEIASR